MNKKVKKILVISGWILIIGLVSFLIFIVNKRQKDQVCYELTINIDSVQNIPFINKMQINKIIKDSIGATVGKPIKDINLQKMEKVLSRIPFLKDVTVYNTLKGEIKIDLKERKPLVHVFNSKNQSFYIDEEGILIPTSSNYTSNVITAIGNISEPFTALLDLKNPTSINKYPILYKIYIVSQFIANNDFWNAMMDQVYINGIGELELIPKLGKHRVIVGNIDNLDEKFNKLMVFYDKVIKKLGWETYETINLKYNNQIVCTTKKI